MFILILTWSVREKYAFSNTTYIWYRQKPYHVYVQHDFFYCFVCHYVPCENVFAQCSIYFDILSIFDMITNLYYIHICVDLFESIISCVRIFPHFFFFHDYVLFETQPYCLCPSYIIILYTPYTNWIIIQLTRSDSYRVATVTTVPDDNITADGFYKVFICWFLACYFACLHIYYFCI